MRFFSHIFYVRGFLIPGPNKTPAFPNAYKNISSEVFAKTYIALPLYFALRRGLEASPFASYEELLDTISKKYPTLDSTTLYRLYSDWKDNNHEELNRGLYSHFKGYGVFRQVFEADDVAVEKWFKDFLNQTYDYSSDFTELVA
jgi:hypothetical protein